MSEEFNALVSQQTWVLVPYSPTYNILGCKWIYKTKLHSDGSLARYKARLVLQGYKQQPGLDYNETFSPVAKMPTVRVFLTVATSKSWPIHQLDVSNAFLRGTLEEKVYMKQPQGFQNSQFLDHICLLKKSLYGLKQSPRQWFATLTSHLHSLRFYTSKSDYSLHIYNYDDISLYLVVYVVTFS